METLRLAKNTLAGVTLLEYPAGANLQRRELQLCLCRDTKLNTQTLTLELRIA